MNEKKMEVDQKKQSKPKKTVTRILFIDSELGTRHLMTNFINNYYGEEGFEADSVGTIAEAVNLLWSQKNDLQLDILVIAWDLVGRRTGLDLAEILRQIGFTQIPIFLLITKISSAERERATFLGVRGFFEKTTLDPEILMDVLKQYKKEFIDYQPTVYTETDRVTKDKDGQEFGAYLYLRWLSPKGKLRGVSLGKSDSYIIDEDAVTDDRATSAETSQEE